MKLVTLFFLATVLADKDSYIFRGKEAEIEDFPYQVGISIYGGLCGGNLISNTYIITAGHCLFEVTPNMVIAFLGAVDFEKATLKHARSVLLHSEYNPEFLRNDIGLVEIDHVDFSDTIQSIALPSKDDMDEEFEAEDAYIAGWGLTESHGSPSSILLYALVQIMNREKCEQQYKKGYVRDTNICAGGGEGGSSTCRGDSGGPLVLKDREILIGITSFGPRGDCTKGSVFTFIPKYRDWISNHSGV